MGNWKNNRPDGWDKIRDLFAEANGGGYAEKTAALEDFEAGADEGAKAQRKKVAVWLRGACKTIYHSGYSKQRYECEHCLRGLLKELE